MKFHFTDFPILETERLILREITFHDKEEVFFLRSDAVVNQYVKRDQPKTIQDAKAFITKITKGYENEQNINWAITLKGDTKMIGSICLWNFSKDRLKAEVGYDLNHMFHNKGYMSEALTKVLAFGFQTLKLQEVEAYTSYRNKSSMKLLIKNSFVLNETRLDKDNLDNRIFELKIPAVTN